MPAERDIKLRATWAVESLAVDDEGRRRLGEAGACEQVVHALRMFPLDRDVQFWSLGAVKVRPLACPQPLIRQSVNP